MTTITTTETIPLVLNQDGVVLVAGTRVTLDTIVIAFNQGATAEEIAQQYPSVSLADIYSIVGYYLHHRSEIDLYVSEREQARDKNRQEVESRASQVGIRARLLARVTKPGP